MPVRMPLYPTAERRIDMERRQKYRLLAAAVLLLVFAAAKLVLLDWWQQGQTPVQNAQCDLIRGCTLPDGTFVRASTISTHAPFDVFVENAPEGTQQISISFSMKNMDMGFNRYNLARQSAQTWQANRIRLPVCIEGRRDYTADINIDGRIFQTAFSAE